MPTIQSNSMPIARKYPSCSSIQRLFRSKQEFQTPRRRQIHFFYCNKNDANFIHIRLSPIIKKLQYQSVASSSSTFVPSYIQSYFSTTPLLTILLSTIKIIRSQDYGGMSIYIKTITLIRI